MHHEGAVPPAAESQPKTVEVPVPDPIFEVGTMDSDGATFVALRLTIPMTPDVAKSLGAWLIQNGERAALTVPGLVVPEGVVSLRPPQG